MLGLRQPGWPAPRLRGDHHADTGRLRHCPCRRRLQGARPAPASKLTSRLARGGSTQLDLSGTGPGERRRRLHSQHEQHVRPDRRLPDGNRHPDSPLSRRTRASPAIIIRHTGGRRGTDKPLLHRHPYRYLHRERLRLGHLGRGERPVRGLRGPHPRRVLPEHR